MASGKGGNQKSIPRAVRRRREAKKGAPLEPPPPLLQGRFRPRNPEAFAEGGGGIMPRQLP